MPVAVEEVQIDLIEAARILGVRPGTARHWSKTGRIPAGVNLGDRTIRWRLGEILEAAEKLQESAA